MEGYTTHDLRHQTSLDKVSSFINEETANIKLIINQTRNLITINGFKIRKLSNKWSVNYLGTRYLFQAKKSAVLFCMCLLSRNAQMAVHISNLDKSLEKYLEDYEFYTVKHAQSVNSGMLEKIYLYQARIDQVLPIIESTYAYLGNYANFLKEKHFKSSKVITT